MIEYLQVRQKSDREVVGIIDNAKSVIWHSVYYGVGDFEIYAIASEKHLQLLQEDNYITRPDSDEIGIIESVVVEYNAQDGLMITASGRFAKSILDRRHIYNLSGNSNKATVLRGNVESAIRSLVANNLISCSFDTNRNISYFELGAIKNIPLIIVDEDGNPTQKQVSYQNLLEYTDKVLEEYKLGSLVSIDDSTNKLQFSVYQGADRSIDNAEGNDPIIFSQEYDNFSNSSYSHNKDTEKNAALIGGEGEGIQRFYSVIRGSKSGIDRREMWVDAASINRTYKDDQDVEHTYTDEEYKAMLDANGKQQLAEAVAQESYEGSINTFGGTWKLNEDYFLGDVVTFQDNKLNKFVGVRIVEITEVQDENGFTIDPKFQFEKIVDMG
ncbi:siphovirus ReqiPepy6 Gp37-like family protein [Solibacillus silvestris]